MKFFISTLYLLLLCVAGGIICTPVLGISATHHAREPRGSKDVIVQLFGWNWDSVAAECVSFLGPHGYGYVQVNPAQESIAGPQWWTDYQPVSYKLVSKHGNAKQYKNMIDKCHSAGVGVIADTIFNHMTGINSGVDIEGRTYTHHNYPGLYQYHDFHHCGLNQWDMLVNFASRYEVQFCQLNNLADLATETEYVRSKLANYANELLSLGVDGLRIDAAKHIPSEDIANILGRLNRKPYVTQEFIYGHGEEVQPSEYVHNGDVQEFRYTAELRNAFLGGQIAGLLNLENRGWIQSDRANVFVANHDTERNINYLNHWSPYNTYFLAHVFLLAHPYGTPTVFSSYSAHVPDSGAPNEGRGTCLGDGGHGGWLCQHRYVGIAGLVGFRNAVGKAGIIDWQSPHGSQIAFGRGNAGFVAINNANTQWATKFKTSIHPGIYCDVVSGKVLIGAKNLRNSCSGLVITVESGYFDVTIHAHDAIAIHAGSRVA